ncbi:PC-esterase domain-containing protein 1A isoform X3 [Ailuropoda melanoleuca]|nr:PC-esterase domain-containing protein 1A isoform X3 [Ailuropoda melanoleuca]
MESYRENLERVFVRMDQVLPDSCLLVWNMAMPLGERVTGGFLLPELQPLAGSLRRDVVEGNFYSATLAGDHCFDVLDLHFHFRHAVRHRHRDGVHWDQHAHRHLSHLLLTHVADAWGVELPKRDYPSDPWIEDWPVLDHPFQGNHGQPPDFGEKLALPPPQLSPLLPPMPFPYPIPQPSLPPLFPPLPQDTPFFPGQPFPPHKFFNCNSTEDFSMSSHLGLGSVTAGSTPTSVDSLINSLIVTVCWFGGRGNGVAILWMGKRKPREAPPGELKLPGGRAGLTCSEAHSLIMAGSFVGCGPGVNFVPGLLPPPVSGPIPHGQHWGPVVHRGMPRCAPNSPYHVPRMGGPCRQRLRHSDRLIHTNKLDRQPPAHSGTWPG